MKMNKIIFLALVTVGAISACGTKASSSSIPVASSSEEPITSIIPSSSSTTSSSESKPSIPDNTDIVTPNKDGDDIEVKEDAAYSDKLLLNRRVVGVAIGRTDKIRGIERALCKGDQLNFAVADETIATVDEDGTVTGVKSGETTVEVSDKNHPDVKKTVQIYVYPTIQDRTRNQYISDFDEKNREETKNGGIKAVCDHEIYERTVFKLDKEGNRHEQLYSAWDQNIVCDKDNAYLRFYGHDGDRKTADGNITFKDYEWIFYTNKFYDTYAFHTLGDVKGYYPVSTVSYMADGDRTAPLFDILDNMFTSGRGIFTNTVEGASLSRFITFGRASDVTRTSIASWGRGSFCLEATFTDTDTADEEIEKNNSIPFGTVMTETDNYKFVVKDYKLVAYSIDAVSKYSFGGDNYETTYQIDHYMERIDDTNKANLVIYPDVHDYTLADYFFAI